MTFAEFLAWLDAAPHGTLLSAAELSPKLRELSGVALSSTIVAEPTATVEATWREKLWRVPPETRLGAHEVAEALGRPVSFVYRHTSEKAAGGARLPHRRLDGELVFVAGEIRAWLKAHEETIEALPHAGLSLNRRRAAT
jgi:predicted DNA-binding transcriptional regulator AlpA